jgi:hypothetical protein
MPPWLALSVQPRLALVESRRFHWQQACRQVGQQTYVTHDETWFELQKQGSVGDLCALVDSRPLLPSEDAISEADDRQAKRNPIRIVGFIMGAPSKLSR